MKKITKIKGTVVKKARKIRVAAYIRVSTSTDAQKESFEAQEAHYQKLFQDHKEWTPVGIYTDEGISGTSMVNRDGLQRLLDDCRQGMIDLIITKSISRFARNLTECLETVRELSSLDVAIHFDKEGLNTQQMDSELLLSMLSALAESESKSISENNKWSFKKRIENGSYRHSVAPYGYDISDGQLVVNEEKASIVKSIFAWYLSGDGTYVIAKRLNDLGIKPDRGKEWRDNSVMYILKNERYIGDALFQKTYTDDNFKRHWNNFEVEMMYVEEMHDPIISREIFDQVQILIEERREQILNRDTKVYTNRYSLTGKIHCKQCGANFIRRTHYISWERSYIAWTCSNQLKDPELCGIKFIKEYHLRVAFINMLNKLVFGRKEILEETIQKLSQLDPQSASKRDKLSDELKEVQDKLYELTKLVESDIIDQAFFYEEENHLLKEKKRIYAKLRRIDSKEHQYSYQLQELKELYYALDRRKYFTRYEDDLMKRYVKKIHVVSRDQVVFELTSGLKLAERVMV